ncbi:hypothetical protein ACIA98_30360 [Streptomyces sp. NPDC051366]|uniref:hypothetical protein n=1 Tax=Streptomyces sp. NPDC051366 TaxID=3365652 RepID=UPI0037B2C7FC
MTRLTVAGGMPVFLERAARLARLREHPGHQTAAEQPAAERGHPLQRGFGDLGEGLADLVAVVVIDFGLLLEAAGHGADRGRFSRAPAASVPSRPAISVSPSGPSSPSTSSWNEDSLMPETLLLWWFKGTSGRRRSACR